MYKTILVLAAFFIILSGGLFFGGESKEKQEIKTDFSDLKNSDRTGNDAEAEEICKLYYGIAGNMAKYLRDEKATNDAKVYACYIVGIYRFEMSLYDLCKIIDLEAQYIDPHFKIARWGKYPAQEAISKIGGRKAIEESLKNLATEKNELRRTLFCRVLWQVESPKIALIRIQDAIDGEKDETKKGNLKLALGCDEFKQFNK